MSDIKKIFGSAREVKISEIRTGKYTDKLLPVILVIDTKEYEYTYSAVILNEYNVIRVKFEINPIGYLPYKYLLWMLNVNVISKFSKKDSKTYIYGKNYGNLDDFYDISKNKITKITNIPVREFSNNIEKSCNTLLINTNSYEQYYNIITNTGHNIIPLYKGFKINLEQFNKLFDKNLPTKIADGNFNENVLYLNENNIEYDYSMLHAYIYQIEHEADFYIIKFFMNGYYPFHENFHGKLSFDNNEITVEKNDDSKYYSEFSNEFENNFYTVTIPKKINEVKVHAGERAVKLYLSKKAKRVLNIESVSPKIIDNTLTFIDFNIDEYTTSNYGKRKPLMVFIDRNVKADDSSEVLYRYMKQESIFTNFEKIFVVSEESKDYGRLIEEGFRVVSFENEDYIKIYYEADVLVSTHASERIICPLKVATKFLEPKNAKFVFLQHGIIMHNHMSFLSRTNLKIDLFCASNEIEKANIKRFSGFDNVQVTGLPRFNNYGHTNYKKTILYAPSWNVNYLSNFDNSQYYKKIVSLLNNETLKVVLNENNTYFTLLLHPEINRFYDLFKTTNPRIKVFSSAEVQYSKYLSESYMLITDYSSILFDFLKQKKTVISYAPYELHHEIDDLKIHKELMYKCVTEVEVVNRIRKILDGESIVNENIYEKLFSFSGNSCENVVNEMKQIIGEKNEN